MTGYHPGVCVCGTRMMGRLCVWTLHPVANCACASLSPHAGLGFCIHSSSVFESRAVMARARMQESLSTCLCPGAARRGAPGRAHCIPTHWLGARSGGGWVGMHSLARCGDGGAGPLLVSLGLPLLARCALPPALACLKPGYLRACGLRPGWSSIFLCMMFSGPATSRARLFRVPDMSRCLCVWLPRDCSPDCQCTRAGMTLSEFCSCSLLLLPDPDVPQFGCSLSISTTPEPNESKP